VHRGGFGVLDEFAIVTVADPFVDGLPVLESERLRLRAFATRDVAEVYELYADRKAVRLGYAPPMADLDDARRVIDETIELARNRTLFHFGVADRGHDRIIGHATLFRWEQEQRRAEVGYSIRRDRWGRGLATEAVGTLIAFAFDRLDLRRIEADSDPRNAASIRVLEKLGFLREGILRERWDLGGEIQDAVIFGLLRSEWRWPVAGLRS
jgi:RimJ/RimL family protein N-acetyltransferase